MRAVRDLRDLVNVSRLSYVDSDNEDEHDSAYAASSLYSFRSSMDLEQSTVFHETRSPKPTRLKQPVYNLRNNPNFKMGIKSPLFSSTTPMHSTHSLTASSSLLNETTRSSFFKESSSLFDRNSRPNGNSLSSPSQISLNIRKPLPPLKTTSISPAPTSDYEIQPLTDKKLISHSGMTRNILSEFRLF